MALMYYYLPNHKHSIIKQQIYEYDPSTIDIDHFITYAKIQKDRTIILSPSTPPENLRLSPMYWLIIRKNAVNNSTPPYEYVYAYNHIHCVKQQTKG